MPDPPVTPPPQLISLQTIQQRILVLRDRQVMLDEDLAQLYGVETRRLTEQVKRNQDRFPPDFNEPAPRSADRTEQIVASDTTGVHVLDTVASASPASQPVASSLTGLQLSGTLSPGTTPVPLRAPSCTEPLNAPPNRPAIKKSTSDRTDLAGLGSSVDNIRAARLASLGLACNPRFRDPVGSRGC
jgi:hypothetical protein